MLGYLKLPYYKIAARRLIKKNAYKRQKYEDRDVLERIIIPHVLAFFNPKKILDVGREDYEKFYNEFFRGRELWTIDINSEHREFGSARHITDDVANIKKYFKNNYFNFILMNGVFGWGLNEKDKIQKAFLSIYDIMNKNGIFILGYNDDIVPLNEIKGLKKMKPYCFRPLGGTGFKCVNGNHQYLFFSKL